MIQPGDLEKLFTTLTRDCKESLSEELEGEEELWEREAKGLTLNWNKVFQSDAHFTTIQATILSNFRELGLNTPDTHLVIVKLLPVVPVKGVYEKWQHCLASQVDAMIVQEVSRQLLNEWIEND